MKRNPRSYPGSLKEPKINTEPFRAVYFNPCRLRKETIADVVRAFVERDGAVFVILPETYFIALRK